MLPNKWATFGRCCHLHKQLYLFHPPLNTSSRTMNAGNLGNQYLVISYLFQYPILFRIIRKMSEKFLQKIRSWPDMCELQFLSICCYFSFSCSLGMLRGHFSISLHIATNHKKSRCSHNCLYLCHFCTFPCKYPCTPILPTKVVLCSQPR